MLLLSNLKLTRNIIDNYASSLFAAVLGNLCGIRSKVVVISVSLVAKQFAIEYYKHVVLYLIVSHLRDVVMQSFLAGILINESVFTKAQGFFVLIVFRAGFSA